MTDMTDQSVYEPPRPTATGNMLVLMRPKTKLAKAAKRLESVSGMKVAVSRDYSKQTGGLGKALDESNCLYLDQLHVAMIRPPDDADAAALSTSLAAEADVEMVRPEFYMFAYDELRQRYQSWVREGLKILADGAPDMAPSARRPAITPAGVVADTDSTWGVKAVKADRSRFTGNGIKVAVLDTGFDLNHPDFAGRSIMTESFVPQEAVDDVQGHGTHCIGSAVGPMAGDGHPRYGVAPEARIFVGKVLNNSGSGRESWILAGMEWAIQEGCEVISMSLGRATRPGEDADPLYEAVGQAALENGSLIVAAAGNESSRRFGFIAPVGAPANSPSIMAVAAVDSDMQVADFSCGAINDNGGEINISGPGVDIFSSFPQPQRHRRLSGTSMATPHVAGVAALLAQSDPQLRGQALWDALRRSAADIGLPISDGGAGLVQAP